MIIINEYIFVKLRNRIKNASRSLRSNVQLLVLFHSKLSIKYTTLFLFITITIQVLFIFKPELINFVFGYWNYKNWYNNLNQTWTNHKACCLMFKFCEPWVMVVVDRKWIVGWFIPILFSSTSGRPGVDPRAKKYPISSEYTFALTCSTYMYILLTEKIGAVISVQEQTVVVMLWERRYKYKKIQHKKRRNIE